MSITRRNPIIWNVILVCSGGLTSLFLEHLYSSRVSHTPIPEVKHPSRRTHEPTTAVAPQKSQVYTYNGTSLQRLQDFCTVTEPNLCGVMKTPSGPVSVYVLHNRGGVSDTIYKLHRWEEEKMQILLPALETYPDAGFVDIGANVGPFSLQIARQGRKVISVDAVFENIQMICKSVEKNNLTNLVTMVVNAVSDEHGSVSINADVRGYGGYGGTKVFKNMKITSNDLDCSDPIAVQTVLLDDLLPLTSFKTALLKIDVEAFEYYVINGGKKFFNEIHVPLIIMEWQHVKSTKNGKALVELMARLNYTPHSFKGLSKYIAVSNEDYMRWPHDVLWLKISP